MENFVGDVVKNYLNLQIIVLIVIGKIQVLIISFASFGEKLITKSQHLENIKKEQERRKRLHERLSLTVDDEMLEIFKKEESLLHLSKDEVIDYIICEYPGDISSLIQRLEIKANEEKSNQIEEDLKFEKYDYLDSIVDDNLLNKLKDYFSFDTSRENII